MTAVATGLRLSFVLLARQAGRAEAIARRRRARRLLLATQVEHPDRVDPAEFAASIRAMKDSPVVAPLLRVITKHPLEHLPADPACPIRVVWAERDRIIPFERNGLPLLERVPGAELVRLAGVGHVPMSDDPEQVARLILEVTGAVDRAHEKDRGGAPIAPHARPSEAS
jgi:pimeloyl-ACP methyl ester carboxylesterase